LLQQGRVSTPRQRLHLYLGVEGSDGLADRIDLGLPDALDAVGDLALQVGEIDRVVVDHGELADTGRAEVERDRRAQAAGADDQGMAVQNALLAFDADFLEQDMARIAQQLIVVHENTPVVLRAFPCRGSSRWPGQAGSTEARAEGRCESMAPVGA